MQYKRKAWKHKKPLKLFNFGIFNKEKSKNYYTQQRYSAYKYTFYGVKITNPWRSVFSGYQYNALIIKMYGLKRISLEKEVIKMNPECNPEWDFIIF